VLDEIDLLIKKNQPAMVCTANANHVRLYREDQEFARIYDEADIVTPDGQSMLIASRVIGTPLKEKVSGIDLMEEICRQSEKRDYKIFFLGAAPGIAEQAKTQAELKFPGIRIVGTYSPSRNEIMDVKASQKIVEQINATCANILCVAFGPPLQEKWIKRNLPHLKAPVSIGVGGAVDYIAGIIKRPPLFIRKIGMEWFTRLIQNPKWYWKRYLKDFKIFYYLFQYKFLHRKQF
jgi:N-acetylglucosaminyldiphosphoundecaprenol N-acetyl-beta-D-mannosaminyltransferase